MRNRSANTLRGGSLQRSNWGGFRLVLQAGGKVIDAIDYTDILCPIYVCQRPYCAEHTRSHQNSEVKQRKARSVLGWGTAWESPLGAAGFFVFSSQQNWLYPKY